MKVSCREKRCHISWQTCDEDMCDRGDVKASCREKHCHISCQTCDEDMCEEGDVKVICRVKNTAISFDKLVMKTCVMEAM